MPLSSSSRLGLRYKPEAVFGTPVSASACYALRTTGESLDYGVSTTTSQEIRSDRATTDLIVTDANASGGFNFELSYGEYDWFLESALQSTFSTVFGTNGVSAVVPTSATFAAGTLTAGAATTGVNAFTNLVLGQWVKIAGSSNALQNIWAQVSKTVSPTSTVLTFEGTPFTAATGAGGAAVTVSSARLSNGTTQRSATIERFFSDITQYATHKGKTVDNFMLDVSTGGLVTGSFDFMGKDMTIQGSSLLHATVNNSLSNGILSATNSVVNVLENGAALSGTFVQSLKMSYANALRGQKAIGVLGNAGVGSGSIGITLNLSMYFADATIYNKFLNNTATSFSWRFQDTAGNGYVFTLPYAKYSAGKVNAGAINQDISADFEITGLLDTVTSKMILIDRAGVAVVPAT
jgi:hypothetical protein